MGLLPYPQKNRMFVTHSIAILLLAFGVSTAQGDNRVIDAASVKPTSASPSESLAPLHTNRAPGQQTSVDAERLMASRLKWEQMRKANRGDYSYTVRWSSAFGFGHLTTIIVRQNRVVERRYEEFNRSGAPSTPGKPASGPQPKWVETESQLGTHGQEGAPARTVDELYAEAARLVSEPVPETHQRSLGITPAGLLHHCTLVDRRVMDDAPRRGVPAFDLQ